MSQSHRGVYTKDGINQYVVHGMSQPVCNNNNNNILIYKAQLHKSTQSAVQLLRNAYKTYKT